MTNQCKNEEKIAVLKMARKAYINGFRPLFVYPGNGNYIGNWRKSLPHGYGVRKTKNNIVYDGQWRDGKRHGHGVLKRVLPTGYSENIYIGQWQNDARYGEGKMYQTNGIYYGWWKNNRRHGLGIKWYNDGSCYLGEWKCDVYQGAGVFYCANGNRYEGRFANGVKNGEGLYYHNETGQLQKGMWENDVCKTSFMSDEFRNQVVRPTSYQIAESKLVEPDKLVRRLFLKFIPKIQDKADPFEGLPCQEIIQIIKG